MFGKNLENLTETNLIILANILKNFKDSVPVKNIQRIVVWLLSVIDKETTWNKHYGGKYSDFTLIGNELVPLDPSKLENIPHSDYSSYLLAPSKAMVLLLDATHLLQNFNIFLHIEGPTQSGKSSFLQFLGKRYYLGIKKTTF